MAYQMIAVWIGGLGNLPYTVYHGERLIAVCIGAHGEHDTAVMFADQLAQLAFRHILCGNRRAYRAYIRDGGGDFRHGVELIYHGFFLGKIAFGHHQHHLVFSAELRFNGGCFTADTGGFIAKDAACSVTERVLRLC